MPTRDEVMIVMIFVRRKVLMHKFVPEESGIQAEIEQKRSTFYDIMKNPNKTKIRLFF